MLVDTANFVLFNSGPIFIAMAAFGTYTWLGGQLTPEVAFPSLVLLNSIRFPII